MRARRTLAELAAADAALAHRDDSLRGGPSTPTFPQERGALVAERARLVALGSTLLPARGPDVAWTVAALRGEHGDAARAFADRVLRHRKHFPVVYLAPFVDLAIASQDGSALELAARWHGAVRVLRAMQRAVESGVMGHVRARFLLHYVRPRADEDAASVGRAMRALREASWRAADAPPGARWADEPE